MLAATAISLPFTSQADEAMSAAELRRYCLSYETNRLSAEGLSCVVYVRGFLDGASAIDSRVRPSTEAKAGTWSDRALRTRLGGGVGARPKFCLKSSVGIHDVIVQLLAHSADFSDLDALDAGEILSQTLRRFHRC
jgi:hypothetical protein